MFERIALFELVGRLQVGRKGLKHTERTASTHTRKYGTYYHFVRLLVSTPNSRLSESTRKGNGCRNSTRVDGAEPRVV